MADAYQILGRIKIRPEPCVSYKTHRLSYAEETRDWECIHKLRCAKDQLACKRFKFYAEGKKRTLFMARDGEPSKKIYKQLFSK